MKKGIISIGVAILLLAVVFSGCFEENKETADNNGSIPQNIPKKESGFIQNLINNASVGDTINIPSGKYYGNIVIDKSINLIGENKNTTIIKGNGSQDVLYISVDNVNISGFTIQNSNHGIKIYSNYSSFTNNIITDNKEGIYFYYSSNNIISGNTINSNNNSGIYLRYLSNNNIIYNNIIKDNWWGISIYDYSSNNTISGNTLDNNNYGIYFVWAGSNVISGNTIKNNGDGIEFYHSSSNIIYHNNLINNTQNANDTGINTWYNTILKEGNYWDDYLGIDNNGDGIGDTPYQIPGGDNKDNYPLMNPVYI